MQVGPAEEATDDSPTVMLPAGTILDSRIRDDSAAPEDRDGTAVSGG